jgi:hypothetical protein
MGIQGPSYNPKPCRTLPNGAPAWSDPGKLAFRHDFRARVPYQWLPLVTAFTGTDTARLPRRPMQVTVRALGLLLVDSRGKVLEELLESLTEHRSERESQGPKRQDASLSHILCIGVLGFGIPPGELPSQESHSADVSPRGFDSLSTPLTSYLEIRSTALPFALEERMK